MYIHIILICDLSLRGATQSKFTLLLRILASDCICMCVWLYLKAWMQFQRFAVDVDKVRLAMVLGPGSAMLASALGASDRPPVLMAYRNTDEDFLGEKRSIEYSGPFVQAPMREWLEKDALMPKLAPFHDEHYQWKLLGSSPLEQEILGLVFSTQETPLELSKTLVAAGRIYDCDNSSREYLQSVMFLMLVLALDLFLRHSIHT